MPSYAEKVVAVLSFGFTIGQRDSRLNTNYPGCKMVVEPYDDDELPTRDGSNGPWCVVGDNLEELVDKAFELIQTY